VQQICDSHTHTAAGREAVTQSRAPNWASGRAMSSRTKQPASRFAAGQCCYRYNTLLPGPSFGLSRVEINQSGER
jgi:hypothetical protein